MSPAGIKSNSSTTPFVTLPAAISLRCGSVLTELVAGLLSVKLVLLFGPTAADAFPVVRIRPLLIGKAGFVLVKYPTLDCAVLAKAGLPLIVTLKAVTPKPNKTLSTNCCGVWMVDTPMDCPKTEPKAKIKTRCSKCFICASCRLDVKIDNIVALQN